MTTKDIKTAKTPQEMQNLGFDTEFNLPTFEALVYNATTGAMDRMVQSIDLVPAEQVLIGLLPKPKEKKKVI